jgi:hypothetical protein
LKERRVAKKTVWEIEAEKDDEEAEEEEEEEVEKEREKEFSSRRLGETDRSILAGE